MFLTTQDTIVKSTFNVIEIPKGTLVWPIKCNDEIRYVVIDINVLEQQNKHDRKHRYVYVPNELVEEVKK